MPGRHGQPIVPLHKKMTPKHWIAFGSGAAATVLLATSGIFATVNYYLHSHGSAITAYSINDLVSNSKDVSRSSLRDALKNHEGGAPENAQYVKVTINGLKRIVVGTDFTTVKSVLEAGNIILENHDSVTPSLDSKVTESTTITITRANSQVQTIEQPIQFNVVEIQDDTLPVGTRKVTTQGRNGVIEQTNLVTKNGDKVLTTSAILEYVKTPPVNEEIHIGVKKSSVPIGTNFGTTIPISEAQATAHDMVIARGWSESDFTALVKLWNKESGWRINAENRSSGAYGIPQALPGNKMASEGADWRTNPKTQIAWGLNYIARRYGNPTNAWNHLQTIGWY